MKLKIFNTALLAFVGLITISTANFAQVTPVAPPAPPATPDVELNLDTKDLDVALGELKVTMKDLQVKLNKLSVQQNMKMKLKMKDFDKKFKHFDKTFAFKFKDSVNFKKLDSVNFAFKFEKLSPMVNFGFKNFDNNFTFNYDTNDDKDVQKGDVVEKTKTYSKTYPVDGNDVISIDNKFGKITVLTWNKSEVKVDVQIKVGANDDDKAQKLLDNVNIRDSKDGNGVAFRTDIDQDDNNGGGWSLFGSKSSMRKMEINYTVYMPARNPLTINNKYGSTDLPDLGGKLTISNSYGSLVTKALSNAGSQINVKYGSANIGSLNGGDLDVAYGGLTLGDCDKINVNISYGSAKIGRIITSGNINAKFSGSLNIGQLDRSVKNLSVNSSYSSVKVGMADGQNADFDVTVNYGSFNYDGKDLTVTSKSPSDDERGFKPTKNYKGHLGKGGTDKNITINSKFGSVSFN